MNSRGASSSLGGRSSRVCIGPAGSGGGGADGGGGRAGGGYGGVLPADDVRFGRSFDFIEDGLRSVATRRRMLHRSLKGWRIGMVDVLFKGERNVEVKGRWQGCRG